MRASSERSANLAFILLHRFIALLQEKYLLYANHLFLYLVRRDRSRECIGYMASLNVHGAIFGLTIKTENNAVYLATSGNQIKSKRLNTANFWQALQLLQNHSVYNDIYVRLHFNALVVSKHADHL